MKKKKFYYASQTAPKKNREIYLDAESLKGVAKIAKEDFEIGESFKVYEVSIREVKTGKLTKEVKF